MSPCFLCFFVIPLWMSVNKCGNRSSSPLQCSEPPDLHNSHFHICIFLLDPTISLSSGKHCLFQNKWIILANFLDFYSGFCRRQIVLPMSLILKLEMQNLISTQKHSEGHWKMRELIVILSHFLCRTYQTRCSTCIAGSTAPTPSPEPSGHYTYLSFLRPQGRRGKHIDKWPPHFSNTRPILTKIIPNVTPWILSAPHLLPKKICPIIPLAFFILQLHLE